ncbi:amiloride-sensitive sodium channel subunit gamma [Elysia marginata]|uniref:Amiloride-sensitive sodium channel subunit gamma n=1 Tax=Elysia marginata TaxID=1093978 RepID=A0AAV4GCX2_9GAST|nr:amiloride-sensitive sodium channel subunit gamma [Elysia marginata]
MRLVCSRRSVRQVTPGRRKDSDPQQPGSVTRMSGCEEGHLTRTAKYGNCYTLQYHKFISRESGPSEGLQLQLFLETDDYVPGVANSKGVQVIIHDQGTLPFPEDEGVAVAAGTETFIGLRRVEVSRLGSPYGDCTPINDFQEKYGIKYTRTVSPE